MNLLFIGIIGKKDVLDIECMGVDVGDFDTEENTAVVRSPECKFGVLERERTNLLHIRKISGDVQVGEEILAVGVEQGLQLGFDL